MTYQNAAIPSINLNHRLIRSTIQNASRKTQCSTNFIECHLVKCHVTTSHLFLIVGWNENLTDRWLSNIRTVNWKISIYGVPYLVPSVNIHHCIDKHDHNCYQLPFHSTLHHTPHSICYICISNDMQWFQNDCNTYNM